MRSKAYLSWLGTQDCIVCGGSNGVVGHHPTGAHLRGTGQKAPDKMAYPLCFVCHNLRHNTGDWRKIWEDKQINENEAGKSYYQKWELVEALKK